MSEIITKWIVKMCAGLLSETFLDAFGKEEMKPPHARTWKVHMQLFTMAVQEHTQTHRT